MGIIFNPFTGNFDLTGSSSGSGSQWTTINETNQDNITPTNGQRLLIGSTANSTYWDTNYTAASAVFDGTGTGGTNYFLNIGYGTSLVSAGGAFIGGRARGSAASPTQALANDLLMSVLPTARDNVGNWVLHNDGSNVLTGLMFRTREDITSGNFDLDMAFGSITTEHLTVQVRGATGNAVIVNNSLFDTDFQVNYDLGTAMFMDGANGQVQFSDGSAGTPAISFVNDPDTGIHRVGANQMSFDTNGLARMQISATTTVINPANLATGDFQVHGDTTNNLFQTDASADALSFFNATPVVQQTGDIKTGLDSLGLFASTSYVSEHRFLVTNAM